MNQISDGGQFRFEAGTSVKPGVTPIATMALETRRAFGPGEDGQRQFEEAVRVELVRRNVDAECPAINLLRTEERVAALASIARRKRTIDHTTSALPGAVVLTERLLRAAEVIAHHGEYVPCRVVAGTGSITACQLVGGGETVGTARVQRWCDHQGARRPVRIEEIALPVAVAARLEAVAREQGETHA